MDAFWTALTAGVVTWGLCYAYKVTLEFIADVVRTHAQALTEQKRMQLVQENESIRLYEQFKLKE